MNFSSFKALGQSLGASLSDLEASLAQVIPDSVTGGTSSSSPSSSANAQQQQLRQSQGTPRRQTLSSSSSQRRTTADSTSSTPSPSQQRSYGDALARATSPTSPLSSLSNGGASLPSASAVADSFRERLRKGRQSLESASKSSIDLVRSQAPAVTRATSPPVSEVDELGESRTRYRDDDTPVSPSSSGGMLVDLNVSRSSLASVPPKVISQSPPTRGSPLRLNSASSSSSIRPARVPPKPKQDSLLIDVDEPTVSIPKSLLDNDDEPASSNPFFPRASPRIAQGIMSPTLVPSSPPLGCGTSKQQQTPISPPTALPKVVAQSTPAPVKALAPAPAPAPTLAPAPAPAPGPAQTFAPPIPRSAAPSATSPALLVPTSTPGEDDDGDDEGSGWGDLTLDPQEQDDEEPEQVEPQVEKIESVDTTAPPPPVEKSTLPPMFAVEAPQKPVTEVEKPEMEEPVVWRAPSESAAVTPLVVNDEPDEPEQENDPTPPVAPVSEPPVVEVEEIPIKALDPVNEGSIVTEPAVPVILNGPVEVTEHEPVAELEPTNSDALAPATELNSMPEDVAQHRLSVEPKVVLKNVTSEVAEAQAAEQAPEVEDEPVAVEAEAEIEIEISPIEFEKEIAKRALEPSNEVEEGHPQVESIASPPAPVVSTLIAEPDPVQAEVESLGVEDAVPQLAPTLNLIEPVSDGVEPPTLTLVAAPDLREAEVERLVVEEAEPEQEVVAEKVEPGTEAKPEPTVDKQDVKVDKSEVDVPPKIKNTQSEVKSESGLGAISDPEKPVPVPLPEPRSESKPEAVKEKEEEPLEVKREEPPAETVATSVEEPFIIDSAPIPETKSKLEEAPRDAADGARLAELTSAHDRLSTLKSSLDKVVTTLVPALTSGISDVGAFEGHVRGLQSKAEASTAEVTKLNGQLKQQTGRIEELRGTHRLEQQSSIADLDALRDSLDTKDKLIASLESRLTHATSSSQDAQSLATRHNDEYDKLKLIAKEEEEKRVKALSLLRALRQKLVKAEKEKEIAEGERDTAMADQDRATETLKSDRARFDQEVISLRAAQELQLSKMRSSFDREVASLRQQHERESAAKKSQAELDVITLKAAHAKEIGLRDARIKELEETVKSVTGSRDETFAQAQERAAELEARAASQMSIESQMKELEFEVNELRDRNAALLDEVETLRKQQRDVSRDEGAHRRALADAEARHEQKVKDLETRIRELETDRIETDEEWDRNLQERLKEVERMRLAMAQKDVDYAESVHLMNERETKIEEGEKQRKELLAQLFKAERLLKALKEENEKLIQAEAAAREELNDKVDRTTALENRVEELQNKESSLRSSHKALREELRKLQSGVLLSEKQRNPGVGFFSSFNQSSTSVATDGNVQSPPIASPPSAISTRSGPAPIGGDEALNFEYIRNVILQFLERPEMRPHLVGVLGVILHFTPAESRRLAAKAG
ncbi:BQ2448_2077 [Microbotryum intermedium]|uniref:BQ2448_2077 protein n=1 Tax=Microbotryum intermedium TaxID=269621 RepID=A0A238F7D1_9BASI|nr:BQ2448_2077 [Microbotryum intermedium]